MSCSSPRLAVRFILWIITSYRTLQRSQTAFMTCGENLRSTSEFDAVAFDASSEMSIDSTSSANSRGMDGAGIDAGWRYAKAQMLCRGYVNTDLERQRSFFYLSKQWTPHRAFEATLRSRLCSDGSCLDFALENLRSSFSRRSIS